MKNDEYQETTQKKGYGSYSQCYIKGSCRIVYPAVSLSMDYQRKRIFTTPAETAYSEIYSPLGTRTMFYLPDGSSGWLNGGSYLEFPAEFRGKSREVFLKGEAYFDVVTDPKKPFVVKGEHTRCYRIWYIF